MSLRKHMPPPPHETEALRVFVEYAPVSMAMLDRDLRYICASRRWREATGNPEEPLVGKQHWKVFPDLPEKWHAVYARCLAGAIERGDRDALVPPWNENAVIYIRWEVRPWHDAQGNIGGLLIFSDDVTSLVQAEEREREAASLLRTFFDSAPFMMGVIEHYYEDVRYIDANAATARFLGLDPAVSLAGRHASELGTNAAIIRLWTRQMRRATQDGLVRFEYQRATPNNPRILEVTLTPVPSPDPAFPRYCFVARDVTEERRAARALAASEERLAYALDATEEGVFDFDVQSGLVFASSRIFQQLGLRRSDALETLDTWLGRGHPDDLPRFQQMLADHLAGKIPVFEMEYRIRHAYGHFIWFFGRGCVVKRDPQGQPLRLVGAQVDITRRKAAEEELRRAKEAALAASEAKSTFLANMSHEIRTPLTSILGYADILREPDLPLGKRTQFVDIIRHSGQHLLSLINSFLDLAKIESGKIETERLPCHAKDVVDEVALLMRERAKEKQLEFSIHCPSELHFLTDPTRLRQILGNLLDNAIKFTRPTGKVALTVRLQSRSSAQVPGSAQTLCFEVSDTGIGISDTQRLRLFQPFVQADGSTTRQFGGTGLGLAISRRLAQLLGGDIELHSEIGAGSRFTLSLPFVPPPEPEPPVEAAPVQRGPLYARILLVEDGPDNQLLLTHVLQRAGATVDVADDGVEGVRKVLSARADHRPYDLILMDIQMPGIDGNAATMELRVLGVETPVVALTAAAMQKNRDDSFAAGCNDFLPKPVDTGRLLEVIRRWVQPAKIP